jgi:RHS repeat-associated protein
VLAGIGHRTTTNGYASAVATQPRQQFTGKERDNETGLDYFEARYYGSLYGRFTSPDEFTGGAVDPSNGQQVSQPGPLPYADITNPQSLNKYAYVLNNPLRYTDPDGHMPDGKLAEFGKGVYETSLGPVVQAIFHPVDTVVGIGKSLTHPIDTAVAIKNSVVETGRAALSGDPRALGQVTGTVVSALVTAGGAKAVSALAKEGQAAKLLVKANAARDALAAEVGGSKAMVVAGYNQKTGQVLAGACAVPGICAEKVVATGLKGGVDGFTMPIRPKSGKPRPVCVKCELEFGREKFPPGTQFESDKK